MNISEKLITIAENEQRVYNKGFEDGKDSGGDGQAEYDRFWDAYQQNGARENYSRSFNGHGWTIDTFKPKYTIHPTVAQYMFEDSNMPIDLAQCLEDLGISLDLSRCTQYNGMFYTSKFTRIPKIVDRMVSNAVNLFSACGNLVTIDEIELEKDIANDTHYRDAFRECNALENIRFTGTGKLAGNISFADSPKLTRESIESICMALANVEGKTLTFSTYLDLESKLREIIFGFGSRPFADGATKTENGITFTNNGNDTILISGTAGSGGAIYNILNQPVAIQTGYGGVVATLEDIDCVFTSHLKMIVVRNWNPSEPEIIEGGTDINLYDGDVIQQIDFYIPEGENWDSFGCRPYLQFDYKYWLIDENENGAKWWNIIY